MKEAYQTELASVAKAKRELKKEENLISGILSGRSRVQVMEITVPEINAPHKAQKNIEETDSIRKAISAGKGGDAENTGSIRRPSSEWIRVENAHEAIIDRNDFDLVQRIRNLDTRTSPQKDKVYLFSGILVCGCCGSRMVRKTNRYKDKEYHYYYCPTGKKNGCAHPVMVKENELMECVRDSLKGFIANVVSLDEILSGIDQSRINRELIKEYSRQIAQNEQQLERIRDRNSFV